MNTCHCAVPGMGGDCKGCPNEKYAGNSFLPSQLPFDGNNLQEQLAVFKQHIERINEILDDWKECK